MGKSVSSTSSSSSDDEPFIEEGLVESKKAGEPTERLHHLDWLRSSMVQFAVMCHVGNTVLPYSGKVEDIQFWKEEPTVDFEFSALLRLLMHARQICIPLLFYISGASFALGKGSIGPFFLKVGAITLIGMSINWVIFFLGPQDPNCSFVNREQPKCQEGIAMDFLIAPYAGTIFPIVFQFWFTVALMSFMAEDFVLYVQLRAAYAGQRLQMHYLVLRYLLVSGLFVALTFKSLLWPHILVLVVCEGLFTVCLILSMRAASRATPETPSVEGRLLQHVAMVVAVVQFGLPNLEITGFNGNTVVYFHFFRQLMAVGFVSTLSRRTVPAVVTRVWAPLALVWIVVLAGPSNYFIAGMVTYPWLPHVTDRIAYMAGTALIIGSLDRLGKIIGGAGLLLEQPSFIGNGSTLMYLIHPIFIALFAKLPGMTTVPLTMLIFTLCVGSFGIASWAKAPTWKPRSLAFCALLSGLAGFVVSVALITFKVNGASAIMLCIVYGILLYWAAANSTSMVNDTKVG